MKRGATTTSSVLLALSLVLGAGAIACSYSPHPESGTLQCSDQHTCPQGYQCLLSENTCWKKGQLPGDGGISDGGAGDRGDSGDSNVNPALKFIGHWVFDSTGKVDETCMGVPQPTASLTGDYVNITAGTASALLGSYYCFWNLAVSTADRTRTTILPNQSCQTTDGANMPITMHGDTFDFQTTDGASGTISATFTANSISGTLTCTFKITGKLTPMP